MKLKELLETLLTDYEVIVNIENVFTVGGLNGDTGFYTEDVRQDEYALWLIDPSDDDSCVEKLMEELPDWVVNAEVNYWWPECWDDRIPDKYEDVPRVIISVTDSVNGSRDTNPSLVSNIYSSCDDIDDEEMYDDYDDDDWLE